MSMTSFPNERITTLDRCMIRGMSSDLLDEKLGKGLKTADPIALPVLAAVAQAHRLAQSHRPIERSQAGLVFYGRAYPKAAAAAVMEEVRSKRRVSPIGFINANAGAPISICCTRLGLRGPTMNLTMGGPVARLVAECLARSWLERRHADIVILIEAEPCPADTVIVTAEILAREDASPDFKRRGRINDAGGLRYPNVNSLPTEGSNHAS